jgi:AraC-like DNA-binding protein/Tfp pilus assembly protein PilF
MALFFCFVFGLHYLCAVMRKLLPIILVLTLILSSCSHQPTQDKTTYDLIAKGNYFFTNGQLTSALECFTQGLEQAQQSGDTYLYYVCLGNLGNVYLQMGDYDRAIHYYERNYVEARKKNNKVLQSAIVTNMVGAYCLKGDVKNAQRLYELQMTLPDRTPQQKQYFLLQSQGIIASAGKHYQLAIDYLEQAIDYADYRHLDEAYAIDEMSEIGDIYLKWNKPDSAIVSYQRCLNLAKKKNYTVVLPDVYKGLAKAYAKKGDAAKQCEWHTRYLDLTDSLRGPGGIKEAENKIFDIENQQTERQIASLTTRNQTQTFIIILVVLLVVLLTAFIIVMRRNYRRLREVQRLLVEKNERMRRESDQQKHLLNQYADMLAQQEEKTSEKTTEKKTASLISDEQQTLLLRKIENVMTDVSVISRSDFSMRQLADAVGSNTKYVSVAINEAYGESFKNLLSEYRIREACRRLTSPEYYDKFTLMGIGKDLGFNSSSAFIAAFKKVTGMTPAVYQRLALNNS